MICKQCNNIIADDSLICESCGYQGRLFEEREKLESLRDAEKKAVFGEVKKPLFLFFTICISISAVLGVISVISGKQGDLLSAIFMVISAIGLWSGRFAKDNAALSGAIRNASLLDGLNKVVYTVYAVIVGLATIFVAATLFLTSGAGDPKSDLVPKLVVAGVISIIMGGIAVAGILFIRGVFSGRRKYFHNLSNHAEGKNIPVMELPVAGSVIIGGINVIAGVSSVLIYGATASVTAFIFGLLDKLGNMGGSANMTDLMLLIQSLVLSVFGGLLLNGGLKLAIGLYYIISGLWLRSAHETVYSVKSEVHHQNVRRLDVERRSKAAYEEWERMQNAECGMQNEECEMQNAECGMQNEEIAEESIGDIAEATLDENLDGTIEVTTDESIGGTVEVTANEGCTPAKNTAPSEE